MKNKFVLSTFPSSRGRRLRHSSWIRDLTSETQINIANLVQPVFIKDNISIDSEIIRMPGIKRFTLKELGKEVENLLKLGIKAIAIFPIVEDSNKSINAKEALNPDNLVCRSLRFLRKEFPEVGVICDIALDPFTLSGHDGVLNEDGIIDNDYTIRILAEMALNYSRSGCEIIAPSDMMDGRVGLIRDTLDKNGFINVQIMSYAVKYASAFYGPFRDALGSSINLSNKSKNSYQMDPKNSDEALREIELDLNEGADMVMVKPGMPYLDIIHKVREKFKIPTYAYQVSGEYSMIKGAIDKGWFDEEKIIFESLIAFKRAGCSGIITYFAPYVAEILNNRKI
mgnify:CR=1 FL=1